MNKKQPKTHSHGAGSRTMARMAPTHLWCRTARALWGRRSHDAGTLLAVVASLLALMTPAPRAMAGGAISIALVPRFEAGVADQAAVLPSSETAHAIGSSFVIEVWAQTVDPNGLSSVSLDMTFSATLTATGVTHSALFPALTHGVIDNALGTIDDVSGSHLAPCTDQVGVAPQWARVAIVVMEAGALGAATVQSAGAGSGVYGTAICGVGDIDPANIGFGTTTLTVDIIDCNANGIPDDIDIASGFSEDCNATGIPDTCELPGDITGDQQVDLADYAPFSACVSGVVPVTLGPGCCYFDGDTDSDIDLKDYAAFQTQLTAP